LIIEGDVKNQFRSGALRDRLNDASLAASRVELYIRCPNLTALEWRNEEIWAGDCRCMSLLRVDLSGCPRLKRLGECLFLECSALEEVVFPKNLQIIGEEAFSKCSALRSITLPENLKIIEEMAFNECVGLPL